MRDRGNQNRPGHLYCHLSLLFNGDAKGLRRKIYDAFVPHIFSHQFGIVLSFASISVLILFLFSNHASTIIQASHVIADVVY